MILDIITMNNPLILGFVLLASLMLLALVAATPGINSINNAIPQVQAVDSASDNECLSASSALFFDSQSALSTASV
jgi:hypothetical protein